MRKTDLLQIEDKWKELTESGNKLFSEGIFEKAVVLYDMAFSQAEHLALHANLCVTYGIPVVPVFLISCNNLSNACQEIGDLSRADALLRRAVFFIIHLVEQEDFSTDTRESAQRELPSAMLAYSDFCEKTKQLKKRDMVIHYLKMNDKYF